MAFSLRSFFGKSGSTNGAAATLVVPENAAPAEVASPFQSVADSNSVFPNSMLFKTATVEAHVGAPVALSPFAPAEETPVAGLTIGDLLPWIPADVAKNPGLPSTHPVTVPDHVLESALRSGNPTIPLYELFRVCPSMFQMAVGPHDSRTVPLPPHKIAHLIPGNTTTAAPQNPFAMMPQHGTPTPSSPFGIVSAPREDEPATASPAAPAPLLFHPAPFTLIPAAEQAMAASPFMTAPSMTVSSPFSLAPESAQDAPQSGSASSFSSFASPIAPAPAPQSADALPAIPSMLNGPVVQSVPGVGSSSQDSSFFSAPSPEPQATAWPFAQTPASVSPFPAAPASPANPPVAPPANWESIFSAQSPAPAAAASLPGVGATFFPVEQPQLAADSPAAIAPIETAPPHAAGFFSNFGVAPAPAELSQPVAQVENTPTAPASSLPTASSKPFNPFERIQALAKAAEQSAPPAADPFAKKPPIDTASFFGGSPLPAAVEPPHPAQAPMMQPVEGASDGGKVVKLNLAASLKNCAAHDLGTNPENIPSWVQFTLPCEMLAGQIATGRVIIPLEAIVAGLDAPIRVLFTQARSGVQVELPSNTAYSAVSEMAPASIAATAIPSDTRLDPFAPVPDNSWKETVLESPAPQQPLWNSPAPTLATPISFDAPQTPEAKPLFTPSVAEQNSDLLPSATPEKNASVIIPANPLTGAPEFVSPAPVLPPQGSFAAVATPRGDNATRRLLLTVLLGSPDATDVTQIVNLTRHLPGVSAALCVNNGRPIAESGDDSPEAHRFLHDAPSKINGLTALASLTGIDDAETLHIQSDQVEATFCLQGAITFAVLHDPRRRETALKEKITLLGREIAAILSESSAR